MRSDQVLLTSNTDRTVISYTIYYDSVASLFDRVAESYQVYCRTLQQCIENLTSEDSRRNFIQKLNKKYNCTLAATLSLILHLAATSDLDASDPTSIPYNVLV